MSQSFAAGRWLILAGCLIAPAAIILLIWAPWRKPPVLPPADPPHHAPDPRLTYQGPYLNVRPDVKYVGDSVCAECHADKAETYRRHPMGRSLQPIAEVVSGPPEDRPHHNPFNALGRDFAIKREGTHIWQCESRKDNSGRIIYEKKTEVDFVIGSGNHGHSYLTNQNGFLYQTPISWYSQKNIWDISPGWGEDQLSAGRTITSDCLFCHTSGVSARPETANGFEKPIFPNGCAIGCERCHGPGELHVHAPAGAGKQDFTIVHPGKLPFSLRQAVCEQCHLEGEERVTHRGLSSFDFRPGLPLESVRSIFVRTSHDEDRKAVNHVEQMYLSRCFEGSLHTDHPLGCVSCHDPHVQVKSEQRVKHYRNACLQCHSKDSCTVSEVERRKTSKEDSCIDCHMPRFAASDIPHTASTNHQIIRDLKQSGMAPPVREPVTNARRLPIRLFHKKAPEEYTPEEQRDEVLALSRMVSHAPQFAVNFLPMLEESIQADPTDFELWEVKGRVLAMQNRYSEALAAFKSGLSHAPNRESLLIGAAVSAQNAGQLEDTLHYWQLAAEVNPSNVACHSHLARIAESQRMWPLLKKHVTIWLEMDPASVEARKVQISYLLHEGDRAQAKAEFAKIEALQPPNLPELQAWFRRELQ